MNLLFPSKDILSKQKSKERDSLKHGYLLEQIGKKERENNFFFFYFTNELKSPSQFGRFLSIIGQALGC